MKDEELKISQLKAECFDRIVAKYNNLQADAGFYSKNWVELAEVIEAEIERLDREFEGQAPGGLSPNSQTS